MSEPRVQHRRQALMQPMPAFSDPLRQPFADGPIAGAAQQQQQDEQPIVRVVPGSNAHVRQRQPLQKAAVVVPQQQWPAASPQPSAVETATSQATSPADEGKDPVAAASISAAHQAAAARAAVAEVAAVADCLSRQVGGGPGCGSGLAAALQRTFPHAVGLRCEQLPLLHHYYFVVMPVSFDQISAHFLSVIRRALPPALA